jgi:phospholipase/lecithinase/hemolysin
VAFGDSLSDSGNNLAASEGTYPSPTQYWQGRYSNGNVWVEQFANLMGITETQLLQDALADPENFTFEDVLFNNAHGGAKSGQDPEDAPPDFLDQLATFEVLTEGTLPDDSLVTVWIGANDFLNNDQLQTQQDIEAAVNAAMQNIGAGLATLANTFDADYILVVNLPDLGATPLNNSTPEGQAGGRQLAQAFNGALDLTLDQFEANFPRVRLYRYDALDLIDNTIASPGRYGECNTTDAALLQGLGFDQAAGYLFWDGVHPTTQAHGVIANQIFGQIFMEDAPEGTSFHRAADEESVIFGVSENVGAITSVSSLDAAAYPSASQPNNMFLGLVEIAATLPEGQTTARFDIHLPDGMDEDYSWFKYVGGEYVDFVQVYEDSGGANGAIISDEGMTVTLVIQDNGPYDTDPAVGSVRDPGGVGHEAPPHLATFDNIVAFGDSLSDSGNNFALSEGTEPTTTNYWQGRYSNGQVWVEELASLFGITNTYLAAQLMADQEPEGDSLLYNFAFGGAETGENNSPPGFMSQLVWLGEGLGIPIPDNSLVTVWIGANDFLGEDFDGWGDVDYAVNEAVDDIYVGLSILVEFLDAQYILVNNLPDLGATPMYNQDEESAAEGRQMSQYFNMVLAEMLDEFRFEYPAVRLYETDVFALMDNIRQYPDKHGFTDTVNAALYQGLGFDEAEGYAFWDGVHPTSQAHGVVAAQAYGDVVFRLPEADATYVESNGIQTGVLAVVAESGTLTGFTYIDPANTSQSGRPAGQPYGTFQVDVTAPGAGQAVTLVFHLPAALSAGQSWYKYTPALGWVDFTSVYQATGGAQGALISADRRTVAVTILDNGQYDLNSLPGFVRDPMAAGAPPGAAGTPGSSDGFCLIGSVSGKTPSKGAMPLSLALLLFFAALAVSEKAGRGKRKQATRSALS